MRSTLDPQLVVIDGRPRWRFADGFTLPVVRGGDGPADDPADDPDDDPDDGLPADVQAQLRKKNNEAKNLRNRLKQLEGVEQRLKEIEDRDKSEVDRLKDQLAEAQARAEKAETALARTEVAFEKGLTPAQAKRLTGATREELEADADDLLSILKPSNETEPPSGGGKPSPVSNRPTPALRGGGDPTTEPEPDMRQVVADIPRSAI